MNNESQTSSRPAAQPCEGCGRAVLPFESVTLGSADGTYRNLCMACSNAASAESSGVSFEHHDFQPITLVDVAGKAHEFHFTTRLLGDRVALDATEIRGGEPRGLRFQMISLDPEGEPLALLGKLVERMKRTLARKHIERGDLGLQITDDHVVRARIESDIEHSDRRPVVVIDGQEIDWDEFGRMLMTFEGWQFKMEIYDPSDER